jgi:hypothetical protein
MHSQVTEQITSWQEPASHQDNQRINLNVLIYDNDDPLHVVSFLYRKTKEGGILYDKALGTATYWHYLLDSLILQADQQARLRAPSDSKETEGQEALVANEWAYIGEG